MKSFTKIALLSCMLSLFVFGDWAMAQQPWLNPNATARSKDIFYKGTKLGVDTPLKILEEALEADATESAAAEFYLAQCKLLGYNGVPKDEKEAEGIFEDLFYRIDIGGDNCARWGYMLIRAPGRNQRIVLPPSESVSFNDLMAKYIEGVRKSAERGDTDAQTKLGMYYTLAMGVPHGPRESVKWIRQAAEKGNADAQLILAHYYAEGYGGLPVSRVEFEKWVHQAAAQGNDMAKELVASKEETQRPRLRPRLRLNQIPSPEKGFQLEPGDVIVTVNGENITGSASLTAAVGRSPQTMQMTVRDRRNGQIRHFTTTLASGSPRFGVTSTDNPGGGARITSIVPNSAATRCFLVE